MMTMNFSEFAMGMGGVLGLVLLGLYVFKRSTFQVIPYESVLLIAFGRCREVIETPGLYLRPGLWIPGVHTVRVSRALDHELISDLHVSDRDGTTLRLDLWAEFRVSDARKSVFAVESWHEVLRNLILHTAVSTVGSKTLRELITDRGSCAEEILETVRAEAVRWGVEMEGVWIQDIRLLPEVARPIFQRVAAQLEMKKSRIEEEGRIRVQTLQAQTERRIAELQARARSMHPLAVGAAYRTLKENPEVLEAYERLHSLSLLPPGKVVTFKGFNPGEVRAGEVLMMADAIEAGPRNETRAN